MPYSEVAPSRAAFARNTAALLTGLAMMSLCLAEPPSIIQRRSGGYQQYVISIPRDVVGQFKTLSDADRKRIVVEWNDVKLTTTRVIEISGTLRIQNANAKLPLSKQGVAVGIAEDPGKPVDWSRGYGDGHVQWSECIVADDGKFSVSLKNFAIHRPIGKKGVFQVALVLGKIMDGYLIWNYRDPILKQSVSQLTIDGQEKLSPAMEAINSVPSPIGWEYDPLAVIQAVNYLQPLGKAKVIAALREFIEKSDPAGPITRIRECIDTSDRQNLDLLVPLLFPSDMQGNGLPDWIVAPKGVYSITVVDGIPFHNRRITAIGKGAGNWKGQVVDWAEKDGKLRSDLLRPGDNPLDAANKMLEMIATRNQRLGAGPPSERLRAHIRWQAWKMVRGLIETGMTARRFDDPLFVDDEKWESLAGQARNRELFWDEKAQKYAARK